MLFGVIFCEMIKMDLYKNFIFKILFFVYGLKTVKYSNYNVEDGEKYTKFQTFRPLSGSKEQSVPLWNGQKAKAGRR